MNHMVLNKLIDLNERKKKYDEYIFIDSRVYEFIPGMDGS